MSKEELLIALLKSKQSHAELYKNKSNNTDIEETRKIFNKIRNKFSKSKIQKKQRKVKRNREGVKKRKRTRQKTTCRRIKSI